MTRIFSGLLVITAGFFFVDYFENYSFFSVVFAGIMLMEAGLFDHCYLSAFLGGPLAGEKIRKIQGARKKPKKKRKF